MDHNPTVAEVAAALAALPEDVQLYEVWVEADPSFPVLLPLTVSHDSRKVWM